MLKWLLPALALSNKLVLISLDGFRWDYLKRDLPLENLRKFAAEGIRAKWLINQFQTKTFPNHWTLVTGLYEESHGIIENVFYDDRLNSVRFYNFDRFYRILDLQVLGPINLET